MTAATIPTGNNATFCVIDGPRLNRSSLELVRAFLHRAATGNSKSLLARIRDPYIPPWNGKPSTEKSGKLTFSRGHRSFHQVLENLRQSASECRVAAVTVKFSEKAARQMVASSKKGERPFINTYANRINKRLRDRDIPAAWFGVVEDSGDRGRAPLSGLHVHLTVAYHVEDEAKIKAVFSKDKRNGGSFMVWKVEHKDLPINVGWSDYQVKHLSRRSAHLTKGSARIYCPNDLRVEAQRLYETQRLRIVSLDNHREKLEHLTTGQCLTLAVYGWIARRSSEPNYDWQYEEGTECKVLETNRDSAYAFDCSLGSISKSAQEAAQAAIDNDPVGQDSDPEFAALLASLADLDIPNDPTPDAHLPTLADASDRGEMPDDGTGLAIAGTLDAAQAAQDSRRGVLSPLPRPNPQASRFRLSWLSSGRSRSSGQTTWKGDVARD